MISGLNLHYTTDSHDVGIKTHRNILHTKSILNGPPLPSPIFLTGQIIYFVMSAIIFFSLKKRGLNCLFDFLVCIGTSWIS